MLERLFLIHAERGGMVILTTHQDMTLMQGRLKTLSHALAAGVVLMLRAVMHLIHRELLMALRQRSDILNPLWFFLIVITLFPLGSAPSPSCWPASLPASSGLLPCWRQCCRWSGCFAMILATVRWSR